MSNIAIARDMPAAAARQMPAYRALIGLRRLREFTLAERRAAVGGD
jgi:hypothetical protein